MYCNNGPLNSEWYCRKMPGIRHYSHIVHSSLNTLHLQVTVMVASFLQYCGSSGRAEREMMLVIHTITSRVMKRESVRVRERAFMQRLAPICSDRMICHPSMGASKRCKVLSCNPPFIGRTTLNQVQRFLLVFLVFLGSYSPCLTHFDVD